MVFMYVLLGIEWRMAEKTIIEPERGGDNIASRRTIDWERYVIDRGHLLDLITLIYTTVST